MSARSQLQSKPVADLREIADGLGLEHKGLQKAKLIDLLLEQGDAIGDIADAAEEEVAVLWCRSDTRFPDKSIDQDREMERNFRLSFEE